ncbi:hypothetical protein SFC88_18385 [Nocardioides sp. HM23]|uniref:hypothetical protein n=1 Tax=Nocardioides bizhenqiangii TaxID=3095076 RepID=UPI002ACA2287|nr:hypothetical protein [Nocardioides sp. HM23]MDZ5622813.1 hypothetical protein [Nocardioides sp. HM23]
MASEPSDAEARDEAQDEAKDQDQAGGARDDEVQDYPGVEDFSKEGDKIKAPEGEFSVDDKGLDGSPVDEILEDRKERLDPENRPETTEVSNAGRDFDGEKGMFTDEEGFDEAEKQYTLDET